ncbi:hypothetical protein LP52_06030 [Streptomonospora alba]|uniref:Uncharacterized protein n=1 Tax=Streptomonospora alba TaxID=183763 RepID=A0A0C2JSF6_9ACTN|nr:hypothetical protein LP52_06030 [Streptomonospora alba]
MVLDQGSVAGVVEILILGLAAIFLATMTGIDDGIAMVLIVFVPATEDDGVSTVSPYARYACSVVSVEFVQSDTVPVRIPRPFRLSRDLAKTPLVVLSHGTSV